MLMSVKIRRYRAIIIMIMIGGSDQDSTSAQFYVFSVRTPVVFSSKYFDLDCVFISNGAPTHHILKPDTCKLQKSAASVIS